VLVVVTDSGPGFPDDSVLARGRSGAGSTGLGLDIARRTAVASGGGLELGSGPAGGARVAMRLGPPAGR
jgi:signal transduction histidine kinase